MRIFLPIVLAAVFIGYLAYLGLIKKNLKLNWYQIVYPGLFFIFAWALIYWKLLR